MWWLFSVDWLGNGVDYTSTPITATFAAETNVTTINVPVTMDDVIEGTEMFDLNIMKPSSESNITLGEKSTAIVYIYDSTG